MRVIYSLLVTDVSLVLDAAHHVRRDSNIHFGRVWQTQVAHDVLELLLVLSQATVEEPLLLHCRYAAALVVMCWTNNRLAREREDLTVNVIIQASCTALLKVCSATAADEYSVTGENEAGIPT